MLKQVSVNVGHRIRHLTSRFVRSMDAPTGTCSPCCFYASNKCDSNAASLLLVKAWRRRVKLSHIWLEHWLHVQDCSESTVCSLHAVNSPVASHSFVKRVCIFKRAVCRRSHCIVAEKLHMLRKANQRLKRLMFCSYHSQASSRGLKKKSISLIGVQRKSSV